MFAKLKSLLVVWCVVSRLLIAAEARSAELQNSVSPNGKYAVLAVQKGVHGLIAYHFVQRATGAILLRIKSTYQEDPDEPENDWWWPHAAAAEVTWRADGRCVALQEANHRRMGTAKIALVRDGEFREVNLDDDVLEDFTRAPWAKVKVMFAGFDGPHRARITVGGVVAYGDGPLAERSFTVTFRLSDGHPIKCRAEAADAP